VDERSLKIGLVTKMKQWAVKTKDGEKWRMIGEEAKDLPGL
jgi:hypothetical protein